MQIIHVHNILYTFCNIKNLNNDKNAMCVCFQYDNLKDICKIGKSTVPVLSDSQHFYTQFYIKCFYTKCYNKSLLDE